jgi:hypothetical protein
MVSGLFFVLSFFNLYLGLYAQNEQVVKITAEIDINSLIDTPLKGMVTITHDKQLSVDSESFQLDKKPITVKFVKEISLSTDISMSIYEFSLPPMPKGLHLLPEISAAVGVQRYTSVPSTYVVKEKKATHPSVSVPVTPKGSTQKEESPVILQLENIVPENNTFYPGQFINVGYRYSYSYGFDLSKEEIPLLEGKGFKKIGGKKVKEYSKGNLAILEVTQLLEAETPGEYNFSSAKIEGRAYKKNSVGQKIYDQSVRQAETSPINLRVISFPEEGKPVSFKGAVGDYDFSVSLSSSPKVSVGDKIILFIKVIGSGAIDNVPVPDICCQPGFSGFFRLSDLPAQEKIEQNTKIFEIELRPLDVLVTEIPSIEFSFFNPQDKSYKTLKSKPIPISVTPLKKVKADEPPFLLDENEEKREPKNLDAIEIEGNYILIKKDLQNKFLGSWKVLLIIPFGIGAILLQIRMKNYIKSYKRQIKIYKSGDIFDRAMKHSPQSSEFFKLLQDAFLLRLVEKGEISSSDIVIDALPKQGISDKVRSFMKRVEQERFSGNKKIVDEDLINEARLLFMELDSFKK